MNKIKNKIALKIYNKCDEKFTLDEIEFVLHNICVYILHTITFIVIASIMDMFIGGIVFYVSYILLRSYAGGAHLSTPAKCYFGSILIFFAAMALIESLNLNIFLIMTAISYIILIIFAPVDNKNKPLDLCEVKHYKRIVIILLFVYAALMAVLYIFNFITVLKAVCCGISIETLMVIWGLIENKIYN